MLGAPRRAACPRGHDMAKTRKQHPNGDTYCSACKKIRYDMFRKGNPELIAGYCRTSNQRRKYGLEPGDFEALFSAQGNCCSLCKTDIPGGRGWSVDHDHETMIVRGILCHGCNTGLGLLKEDSELLLRAVEYLKKGKK